MQIDGITIYAGEIRVLSLNLSRSTRNDRYILVGVDGLDRPSIRHSFVSTALDPSEAPLYFPAKETRDVELTLRMNPRFDSNESFASLRDELYRASSLDAQGRIRLCLTNGGAIAGECFAKIAGIEAPLMSKQPQVRVKFECESHLFVSPNRVELTLADMQIKPPSDETVVFTDSLSTAPHGVDISIQVLSDGIDYFAIYDGSGKNLWEFETYGTGTDFGAGADIRVRSYPDAYDFSSFKTGLPKQEMISSLVSWSQWPMCFPGRNEYRIPGLGTSFALNYIRFYPTYGGV